MIQRPLHEINEKDLLLLIENKIPEKKTIEYKSKSPATMLRPLFDMIWNACGHPRSQLRYRWQLDGRATLTGTSAEADAASSSSRHHGMAAYSVTVGSGFAASLRDCSNRKLRVFSVRMWPAIRPMAPSF